jgi:hypothetical protein
VGGGERKNERRETEKESDVEKILKIHKVRNERESEIEKER